MQSGDLIGGRFELEAEIGAGGSATVWRARHVPSGAVVAVKMLRVADPATRTTLRRRLETEGRILKQLDHPHVLRILDVGGDEEIDWIATEFAEGGSLADMLDREGPLPPRLAVRYAQEILAALSAAHEAGVIHRDVKPANVLVVGGVTRLADFGIAIAEDDCRRTRTGVALGSWAYMAPEQRLDARSVGPTADVYAAAATLYHLLTGVMPTDLFMAGRNSPRWDGLADPLVAILRKATSAIATSRHASASAFARALGEVAERLGHEPLPRRDQGATPTPAFREPTRELVENRTTSVADAEPIVPPPDDEAATPSPSRGLRPLAVALAVVLVAAGLAIGGLRAIRVALPSPAPGADEPIEERTEVTAVLGTWRGRWNDHGATLELRLDDDGNLQGELHLALADDAEVVVAATGEWDGQKRILRLHDLGSFPMAGDSVARLTPGAVTLEGRYTARQGGATHDFVFVRAP